MSSSPPKLLFAVITVYILWSEPKNRFYVGHTANLRDRFEHHNQALSRGFRVR
ncbi:MAG: GIY-YIG nuclease family protein [Armatimonadetes bacterium]|nr:GIY-YIG nuclease family protein [Armatimonadota bacterium]